MIAAIATAMAAMQMSPPVTMPARNGRMLWAWMPGEARCGDALVAATAMRRPYLAYAFAGNGAETTVTYRFRLDASGRPLSIARDGERYVPYADDLGPSLAASRLSAGLERRGCTITYAARRTTAADTPFGDLVSYTLNPTQGQLPHDDWAAIFPAVGTCANDPHPEPLLQAYPDFARVAGTPGVRDWTMLTYDLDAKGAPVRVAVLTSTGNATLDAAAGAALARSRYTHGPRTACRYPFWKAAATLPAPPDADKAAFRPAAATCPASVHWATQPPLVFPEAYRKRAIEGWALIGFDLAPWGATGAVKVLASEPSAEFGEAAAQLIRATTVAASPSGASGCVERVRFVMSRPGLAPNTGASPVVEEVMSQRHEPRTATDRPR